MQKITLEKTIRLATRIEQLKNLSYNQKYEYIPEKTGIRVLGSIDILASIISNEMTENITTIVEVDIFVPSDNIYHNAKLNFSVCDINYKIRDEIVTFYIQICIQGWKNDEPPISIDQEETLLDQNELEEDPVIIDDNIIEDDESDNDEIIKIDTSCLASIFLTGQIVEKVAEIDNSEVPVYLEDDVLITSENKENIDETIHPVIIIDDIIDIDNELEKNNGTGEEIVQEKSDDSQAKTHTGNSIFSIFKNKETINIVYRLHSVMEGDTLESIAKMYGVSVDQILKVNTKQDLKEGRLVFIP